ncbi:MAG TPA: hypothetical protein VFE45_12760, partial [Coriobacteriia bacterium]|nr:hypothetical protein [Coriobacteriia bacterium]
NSMRAARWALSALLTLLLAACGGTPTAEEGSEETAEPGTEQTAEPAEPVGSASAAAPSEAGSGLEAVYAELEGLTGEERRTALIELASEECDDPISIYTTMNVEDIDPVVAAFTEDTAIEVEVFRGPNQDILNRVLQEESAQIAEVADVIAINDLEQAIIAREGLLAPLDTPATEGNAVVHDTWAGSYLAVYLAAWNTNNVPAGEEPDSWEAVFTDYPGQLAYQLGDVSWFATLVNDYYVAEQGMTEREAVDMIKAGMSQGAQIVNGHTLGANLLLAGEYSVASSLYHHTLVEMIDEGAPVAWEPAVNPMIVRSNGVGIHERTQCPASALLLTEFMLTDMQPMLPDFGRTPALEGVPGGLSSDYDP